MRVLQVALPLPLPPMSYLPPLGQEGEEALGRRVAVPWRGAVSYTHLTLPTKRIV